MKNEMNTLGWFIFIIIGVRYEYGKWNPFIIEKDGRFKPKKEMELIRISFWGLKKSKSKYVTEFKRNVFVCFDSLQKCKDFMNHQPPKEIRHEL